jgi:transposase-like protein
MAKKRGDVKEKPLDIDERAELKQLREENRRLKMERDFLKKAAAVRHVRGRLVHVR